jgi:predicted RNA binding protein YcfA (HicA-like mRNA interferase family)
MKVRDVVRRLEADGWRLVRQKGSHRAYKHPEKPLVVTVAGNWNDDLPVGTLKSILNKAKLKS